MKKIVLLSALVLGLGFTSCDGYEEPNPPAQSNPQTSILKTDDVKVTGALVPGQVYSLDAYNNNGEPIQLGSIQCSNLPEGYEFVTDVQASIDGFETSFKVPSTVARVDSTDIYNITVSADNLNGAYVENVTKNPADVNMEIRFNVLTQLESQLAYVGGPSNFYGPYEVTVKPFQPSLVIEDSYYLVGTVCNWNVAQAVKFNHEGSRNVYDDPIFTLVVEVTNDQAAAGYQWKIIPQSTFEAGNLNGNTNYGAQPVIEGALEGTLVEGGNNGVVTTAGRYLITINMEAGTYKFDSAFEYLSVPFNVGSSISATQWNNNFFRLPTTDYVNYSGIVRLYQNWFLSAMPAMDGINFMAGGDPVTDPETGVITGSLVQVADYSNGTRMVIPAQGMYQVKVNIIELKYQVLHIESISLVGAFNDWNEKEGAALTPGNASRVTHWTATGIHMTEGEYKLVANHSWAINWGGQLEDLVQDGGNLSITEEGDYDFELIFNPGGGLTTLTVTKK